MNSRNISVLAITAGLLGWLSYRKLKKSNVPEVAPYVDLERYLGQWYEIARKPVSFEKACYGTQAHYSLRKDGNIQVVNTCHKCSLNGPKKVAKAKAWVVDPDTNAKLKVQFFWPFTGDYWILEVGRRYQYALVGDPSRKTLWILSRKPTLSHRIVRRLLQTAQEQGFRTDDLIFTSQHVS